MTTADALTLLGIALALGAAVVNWNYARTANRHAAEAVDLAKSADDRADRTERTTLERRDVVWTTQWIDDMRFLQFSNVGTDIAHDVELIVDAQVLDRRFTTGAEQVRPTETIGYPMTEAYERAHEEFNYMLKVGVFTGPHMGLTARITWRSETGVPAIQAFDDLNL